MRSSVGNTCIGRLRIKEMCRRAGIVIALVSRVERLERVAQVSARGKMEQLMGEMLMRWEVVKRERVANLYLLYLNEYSVGNMVGYPSHGLK